MQTISWLIRATMVASLLFFTDILRAEPLPAGAATNPSPVIQLHLNDYIQNVLRQNNTLQSQTFQSEAARRKEKAEYGAFEPQLEVSVSHEANKRSNNIVEQASQSGQPFFDERNNIYDGGIESLLPTGAKVRLGYTLSDLGNNVNPNILSGGTSNIWTRQWQTFVGVTLTQPLLQNAGTSVTLAELRLAAADSEIGFQQYRRQLMLTVAQAENAYWNLYFAQEQLRFFDDSVSVAQNILNDSQEILKAGRGAELDVMEAQSGLALRQTKRNEVLQNYLEAMGNLQAMAGIIPASKTQYHEADPLIRVVDAPPETNSTIPYEVGFADAIERNPDFLIQKQKVKQEELRLGVARNQRLPQLDLKTAYGFNGLGASPDDSWLMAEEHNYTSWSVGVQLTVPLGGNIKARNLAAAAKLNLDAAYASLDGVEAEIANHLNSAVRKSLAWQDSIHDHQTVVHFNEELLRTETARLKAGTIDARKVLEVEADLLDARQNLASALTQFQQAGLQVSLASGLLLETRHLEVTRDKLKQQSADLVRHRDEPKYPTNY